MEGGGVFAGACPGKGMDWKDEDRDLLFAFDFDVASFREGLGEGYCGLGGEG